MINEDQLVVYPWAQSYHRLDQAASAYHLATSQFRYALQTDVHTSTHALGERTLWCRYNASNKCNIVRERFGESQGNIVSKFVGSHQPPNSLRDLKCVIETPGDFHASWAYIDVLFATYWGNKKDVCSLSFCHSLLGRKTNDKAAAYFFRSEELILLYMQGFMAATLIKSIQTKKAKVISFQHLFHMIAVAHDSILAHSGRCTISLKLRIHT